MKLPIIQSLWIGDPLTNIEKLCIQSFLDHGHEFHLYVYDDVGAIPAGAVVRDGNEILPADKIWHIKRGKYAQFSDYFRYEMLHKNGGWWVDMDVFCLKPFDFNADIVAGGGGHPMVVNNCVLKFSKGHEVMRAMADACANRNADQAWDTPEVLKRKASRRNSTKIKEAYLELGPEMLTNVVNHYGLDRHVLPATTFSPTANANYIELRPKIFTGIELSPHTYAIHLSISGLSGIDKNSRFPDDSLLERLKVKHGITNPPNAPFVSGEQIVARQLAKRKARIKREWTLFLLVAFLAGIGTGLLF